MTHIRMYSRRQGKILIMLGLLLVVLIGGGLGVLAMTGDGEGRRGAIAESFPITRGDFDITIPTTGELAAMNQVEVRNELESRAAITWIIDEGVTVEQGDTLFRLNDEDILNSIKDAEEAVNNADNSLVNARSNLANRQSSRESQLAQADLDIELADLALKSWEEGENESTMRRLKLDLETAQKEKLRRAEQYGESERLAEKGFISRDELKADEIAMIRANADLEQAELALEVYEKYTIKQNRKQKESDLEQAREERERLEKRLDAEVRSAESDVRSRERNLSSKKERLEKLQKQLTFCIVTAPTDGLVVYQSSLKQGGGWRGNDGQPPQVGTELRRNETVIVLPDTSVMVAEVKVNEALMGMIAPGQQATVTTDANRGRAVDGAVIGIGVLAEGGSWRDPNRRDYTVRVQLDTEGLDHGMKPSMRCRADIYVGRVEDALYVPVQAVFRDGGTTYVYTPDGTGYAQTPVKLGRASELFVELKEGPAEGTPVLLRAPRLDEVTRKIGDDSEAGNANGNGKRSGNGRGQRPDMSGGKPSGAEGGKPSGGGGRPKGT